uniref:Uncharacterized protein n=1 Tax=Salarias fasciatus TaxID=181472 RepID=A0A672HX54_SALFA
SFRGEILCIFPCKVQWSQRDGSPGSKEDTELRLQLPVEDTELRLQLPVEDTELCLQLPVEDTELCLQLPVEDTELCLQLPVEDTELRLQLPVEDTELLEMRLPEFHPSHLQTCHPAARRNRRGGL